MAWQGVMPAITTPFDEHGAVDHAFLRRHVEWQLEHGITGLVPLGSLGEGATLEPDEKAAILQTCVETVSGRIPVIPGIAAASTAGAVRLAQTAAELGCRGLMVLPPYLHAGPTAETTAHMHAVLEATALPCMLYNNPIAYGTDFVPAQIAQLADAHPRLAAVKESSGDVRRMTAIRALLGDRLAVFVGLDDLIVEGRAAGATGWIAGLVNALPGESVRLFELAAAGGADAAALYRWFLPLLRLDTVPEFVQLIKLVQQEVGMGSERVRAPRQPVAGPARDTALALIKSALAERPA